MTTALEVSRSYWASECRRDVDAVMEHYHEDATYEDASGLYRGYAAIRAFYEASAESWPGLRLDIVAHIGAGDRCAIEYEAELTDVTGSSVRIRGVNLVTVREGRFESVRSYEDPPEARP